MDICCGEAEVLRRLTWIHSKRNIQPRSSCLGISPFTRHCKLTYGYLLGSKGIRVTMDLPLQTVSANTSSLVNGENGYLLRPRAVKPSNPQVSRTQIEENVLKPNSASIPSNSAVSRFDSQRQLGALNNVVLRTSSGRSTPIPQDAPPSVRSLSFARRQVRAQQRHRLFPSIEYSARVSHFHPSSDYRDFRG